MEYGRAKHIQALNDRAEAEFTITRTTVCPEAKRLLNPVAFHRKKNSSL